MKTLGYCGLDCGECPVFIAAASNDEKLRQKTAKEWSLLYAAQLAEYTGRDELKAEDMNCSGCHSQSHLFIGCMNCPIRKCAREKRFITCAGCNEYGTCGMLNGFFSVHQNAKGNLDRMRTSDTSLEKLRFIKKGL